MAFTENGLGGGLNWSGYSPRKYDAPTPSGRSRHLGQVMAEAVAAATVYAELAQCGGAGRTLGEATGVVSLNHS